MTYSNRCFDSYRILLTLGVVAVSISLSAFAEPKATPKFDTWGVAKEVRGVDGWYIYAFTDAKKEQVLGMIVTNMMPKSIERGGRVDRLTFELASGGQIRLAGNRGLWSMVASDKGGLRQRTLAVPAFKEHPIDRYQRLLKADPTLTVKRYIETDAMLKVLVAEKAGALPGGVPHRPRVPRKGVVDPDKPLGPQIERAALIGDLESLGKLIKLGADVNGLNSRGEPLLGYAAEHGSIDVVEMLLKAGAKHDKADKDGQTPFRHAVSKNNLRIAQRLLDAGADIEVLDDRKRTALAECVGGNRIAMAELLLKNGASPSKLMDTRGQTMLMNAAISNDVVIAALLIKYGADLHAADDSLGQTALHYAVNAGHVKMVETLLAAGARTDIPDRYKNTPLSRAQREHRYEILELMSKHAK